MTKNIKLLIICYIILLSFLLSFYIILYGFVKHDNIEKNNFNKDYIEINNSITIHKNKLKSFETLLYKNLDNLKNNKIDSVQYEIIRKYYLDSLNKDYSKLKIKYIIFKEKYY